MGRTVSRAVDQSSRTQQAGDRDWTTSGEPSEDAPDAAW